MRFEKIDSFEFDGQSYMIEKFKSFNKSCAFREACLPSLLICHLRPLEIVASAIINQWAPLDTWYFFDSVLASEREIDRAIYPVFKTILNFYVKDKSYTDAQLDTLMPDHTTMYSIIHSQIQVEGLMDYYLRRKTTFIQDVALFFGYQIDAAILANKAQDFIARNPPSAMRTQNFLAWTANR